MDERPFSWRDGSTLIAVVLACTLSIAAPATTTTIPFHVESDMLIINVFVDGRSASLILDTGAKSTFLSPESVGMTNTAGVSSLRSNALIVKTMSRHASISLTENGSIFSQPVTVVNLTELNKRAGSRCDGILGEDFLRNFRAFTIDYKSNTVSFRR
jgi:hypothetical protein